jgi:hypothetical protein
MQQSRFFYLKTAIDSSAKCLSKYKFGRWIIRRKFSTVFRKQEEGIAYLSSNVKKNRKHELQRSFVLVAEPLHGLSVLFTSMTR